MKAHCALLMGLLLGACGGGGGAGSGSPVADPGPTVIVPAPVASAPVTPPPATLPGWTLVWSDEFDVDGLPDASKWAYDTERNKLGWYNNEKQYYASARLENSRVEGGKLIITARKETLNPVLFTDYGNQPYTSARLITRGKASWTYGLYEVRAKLPCSLGTWPAIWTLGTGGVWPDDGEIDLMEQRGTSAADKGVVLGTIHTRAFNYYNGLGVAKGSSISLSDACTGFHNYQLTWSADKLQLGVDGNNYFEYLNPKDGNYEKWPFDKPQYLILNLAMGGDLGGVIPAIFVSDQMEVDYVRVYQR
jgi:beta-glucanase (GH16 family)